MPAGDRHALCPRSTRRPLRHTTALRPFVAFFLRYLARADEFQRLVQLRALALGFGGSFFFSCGYSMFVLLGAPDLSLVDAAAVGPGFYSAGILSSAWRYR